MKLSLAIGILLLAGGILMPAFHGVTYTRQEHLARFGPISIVAEEQKSIPLPSLVGIAALGIGGVLTVEGVRRG